MRKKTFIESREEMEEFLHEQRVGYLGLSRDGMPYVVPLNYGYVDGRILFHGSLKGKKLDYLMANPQVCFTVGLQADKIIQHPHGSSCPADTDSVICYGLARIVENVQERREILNAFNRCMQSDTNEITPEAASGCCAVEIKVTEMTGRRQRGLEHTYWRYRFQD